MLLLALIIDLENDHENQVAKYLVHMIHMDQMLIPKKKYRLILQSWFNISTSYFLKKIHYIGETFLHTFSRIPVLKIQYFYVHRPME